MAIPRSLEPLLSLFHWVIPLPISHSSHALARLGLSASVGAWSSGGTE
jgi:hypothetical protein